MEKNKLTALIKLFYGFFFLNVFYFITEGFPLIQGYFHLVNREDILVYKLPNQVVKMVCKFPALVVFLTILVVYI